MHMFEVNNIGVQIRLINIVQEDLLWNRDYYICRISILNYKGEKGKWVNISQNETSCKYSSAYGIRWHYCPQKKTSVQPSVNTGDELCLCNAKLKMWQQGLGLTNS